MFKKYSSLFLLILGVSGVGNMANAICEDQSQQWCKDAQVCASRLKYCIINGPKELTMYLAHQPPGQRDVSSNKRGIEAYQNKMSSRPGITREEACLSGCKVLQDSNLCTDSCQ